MTAPTTPLSAETLTRLEKLARAAAQPCRTKPCTDYDECAPCDAMSPFADALVSEEGARAVLALVAAARERDELRAAFAKIVTAASDFGFTPEPERWATDHAFVVNMVSQAERCPDAEKERDELRAKVAELSRARGRQTQQLVDGAYAKGREDERRDVVAWMREKPAGWRGTTLDEPAAIERGEHVTANAAPENAT